MGVRNLYEIDKVQSAFFEKLLFLPLNTPSYTLRLETGIQRISVFVFRSCLSWINKILKTEDNRYDKDNSKYNWATQIQHYFFDPIGTSLSNYLKTEGLRNNVNFLVEKLNKNYLKEDLAKN